ncbi:MAG: hypothetical protein ACR2RE_20660 [Geminicoccaceae bacterium]
MSRYAHVVVAWTEIDCSTMPVMREDDGSDRPHDSTPSDLLIVEGETVEILDESGPWIWIATADGYLGWVPASTVRERSN